VAPKVPVTAPADASPQPARAPEWRKRLDGLVPTAIERKSVLVVGCGSVGSFIASELVRAGVRTLCLVDPDDVEWANLSRTVYAHRDLGKPKVEALREHLLSIFPDISVTTHAVTVQDLGEQFGPLLDAADIVLSAVDQPAANGRVNRLSHSAQKPVVFVGLYRGAKGGEVITTLPGKTACYHCSTGGVRKVFEEESQEVVRTQRDYGTNRLIAEVALGSDIHFVCAAAVKIVLSMLARGSLGPLGDFMDRQLEECGNFVVFGMEPEYYLFPSTHSNAVGQYAFQSIWLSTASDPLCEVCGGDSGS
jgi:molybdopterin-synthase adenylyltransferase